MCRTVSQIQLCITYISSMAQFPNRHDSSTLLRSFVSNSDTRLVLGTKIHALSTDLYEKSYFIYSQTGSSLCRSLWVGNAKIPMTVSASLNVYSARIITHIFRARLRGRRSAVQRWNPELRACGIHLFPPLRVRDRKHILSDG